MTTSQNTSAQADPASTPLPHTGRWVSLAVVAITLISIALLLLNATLLVINAAGTMDSNAQYARSQEIKRSLSAFQFTIATAEAGQRGYLLTGQSAYLEPFLRASSSWRGEVGHLRRLVADNGGLDQTGRVRDLDELESRTANAIARLEHTIEGNSQPGLSRQDDVTSTGWATAGMDRVRELVERMMQQEDTRIEALRGEVVHDMWLTVGIAVFTTVLTVGVLMRCTCCCDGMLRPGHGQKPHSGMPMNTSIARWKSALRS